MGEKFRKYKTKFNFGDLVKITGKSTFDGVEPIQDMVFTVYVVSMERDCNKYTVVCGGVIDRLEESQLELYQAKQYD
jgi:hypothetical protein